MTTPLNVCVFRTIFGKRKRRRSRCTDNGGGIIGKRKRKRKRSRGGHGQGKLGTINAVAPVMECMDLYLEFDAELWDHRYIYAGTVGLSCVW